MTEEKEKQDILGLLGGKKERLGLILQIARKQKGYLESDDIETLTEAVEERRKLIEEIREMDRKIDENGLENSESCRQLLADIKNILREIASEDKINIKAAEDKVEEYKKLIRGAKNNKNRIVSYQNAPLNQDGIYIDKKK